MCVCVWQTSGVGAAARRGGLHASTPLLMHVVYGLWCCAVHQSWNVVCDVQHAADALRIQAGRGRLGLQGHRACAV